MKKKIFISFFLLLLHYVVLGQCISNIDITGVVSSPNIIEKQASSRLTAANTINNGAGAIYRSGNDILLNDGFNAKDGSIFNAYIGNCTDYICPLPKNVTAVQNDDTSINLSWNLDSPSSITSWRIRLIPELTNNISKDIIYNGTSPYVVPPGELSSGANYTFKINPICDPISSINYVQSTTFKAPKYKELIWNNRLKLKNWQHLNLHIEKDLDPTKINDPEYFSYCSINDFTDEIINRPKSNDTSRCYFPNSPPEIGPIDNTGSVMLVTANYKSSEYITGNSIDKTGFKFDTLYPPTTDNPIEFNTYNQMLTSTSIVDYERLHEVGLLFWHWPNLASNHTADNSGAYSFKRSFNLGEFEKNIIVSFKAKINKSDLYDCTANSYLTADLRFTYYNESGTEARSDLIGVVFYENNNYNPKESIYWSSIDDIKKYYRLLMRGSYDNVKQCNYDYQEITINYKNFINQLPPPPTGFTYNDAIIRGLDIYSNLRGKADLNFSIKDVKILGASSDTNIIAKNGKPTDEIAQNTKVEKTFMKISQNPNSGIFKILFNESINGVINIIDVSGKMIYNKDIFDQKEAEVNLLSYSKGIYFIKVRSEDKTYTEKIIIK
ncbi:MAG: T9SS type A sorting domain-containing protein [Chryseobacterium sp.]|nr:T9SS type A sorting domain-containing protein [Chryseobacterium sp.]